MISYTLKQILELVPEALPLVKQASLEEDYPLGNKSGCVASALRIGFQKQAGLTPAPLDVIEKVATAVEAYGVEDEVNKLLGLLSTRKMIEKTASVTPESYMTKQANFEGDTAGFSDLAGLSKQAEALLDMANAVGVEPSDTVKMYACSALLLKEAAAAALGARYQASGNDVYLNLAASLGMEKAAFLQGPVVNKLCAAVTNLDHKAGLDAQGFNFYKEALLTKSAASAASSVVVGGKEFPLDAVLRIPRDHIASYLGEDIAKELNSDPVTAKAVVESLPSDLQQVLLSLLKNC